MKCLECQKEKCEKCGKEIIGLTINCCNPPVCNHYWVSRYGYYNLYYYPYYGYNGQGMYFIGNFCMYCGIQQSPPNKLN